MFHFISTFRGVCSKVQAGRWVWKKNWFSLVIYLFLPYFFYHIVKVFCSYFASFWGHPRKLSFKNILSISDKLCSFPSMRLVWIKIGVVLVLLNLIFFLIIFYWYFCFCYFVNFEDTARKLSILKMFVIFILNVLFSLVLFTCSSFLLQP